MSDNSQLPVAILYSFGGSCWAAAPRLTLIEKGYGPDECTIKDVDLLAGANFSPEYLKINTAGTVPTLVVPQLASAVDDNISTRYTALTTSESILEFLDSSRSPESRGDAPARSLQAASIASKQRDDALIKLVHAKEADPNFLLLSIRDQDEAKEKAKGIVGRFVEGRKSALESYLKETQEKDAKNERLVNFYKQKLKAMNDMSSILSGSASSAVSSGYFQQSQTAWQNLVIVVRNLNVLLPREDRSGFITLADLHVGAWFARVVSIVGVTSLKETDKATQALAKAIGAKAEELQNVQKWWETMAKRESFQTVYKDSLF